MLKEREWLRAEQSGQEDLAEAMFARVVAEMPAVEPSAGFVGRTVRIAWQARGRRLLARRAALIAAAILIGMAGAGSIHALAMLAAGLVVRGTVVASQALVWLLVSAEEGIRWWWIAERIGTAVRVAVATPSTGAALMAGYVMMLLAIYAFGRLLGPTLKNFF